MLRLISVLLLSLALLARSLPGPFDSLFGTTAQETFDAAQIRTGDRVVEAYPKAGALPSPTENKTIYEVICADPQFSKLAGAVNFSESIIPLLNDSSTRLTFFAVPDWALKRPKRILDSELLSTTSDLAEVLDYIEALATGDKDKRKFLKALVSAILRYHVVTAELPSLQPAEISTFPTNLSFQYALDDEAQRIRVQTSLIPPSMVINLYSNVVRPNIHTNNGIIHVVNHPLIPPFPAFSQVFDIPRYFSFFTSAFQRSSLSDELDLHWMSGKKNQEGHFTGTSAVTSFIPSNHAFQALPKDLQLYLFSPFGARVLKKLLQFHVVPGLSLHTDYLYNATSSKVEILPSTYTSAQPLPVDDDCTLFPELLPNLAVLPSPPPFTADVISSANITVPTLLKNHSLPLQIVKYNVTLPFPGPRRPYRIITKVWANGQPVAVPDVVAMNGAMHVITRLIDPRVRESTVKESGSIDSAWENWEDWLPQWAQDE